MTGTSEGARKGQTPESRAKKREAMLRKWADPQYRAQREAIARSPEVNEKRSASLKAAWARDPERRERQAEVLRNLWNDAQFQANTLAVVAHRPPTDLEALTIAELDKLGIQYIIHHVVQRWEMDIYIPSLKLDIEVDNVWWHSDQMRDSDHDQRRDAALASLGYEVLRISGPEIKAGSLSAILKNL